MAITQKDVERVARLAHLYLTKDEASEMTHQLARIVNFVEKLNELDTTNVEPFAHDAIVLDSLASDEPAASLHREAALGNAPDRDEQYFRVPAVLGD